MVIEAERGSFFRSFTYSAFYFTCTGCKLFEIIPVAFYSDSEHKSPMLRFQSRRVKKRKERANIKDSSLGLAQTSKDVSVFPGDFARANGEPYFDAYFLGEDCK